MAVESEVMVRFDSYSNTIDCIPFALLKIGQELGGINPEEYFADGNLTQKAKRTTLYTLWNKPPGYEEIIRPLVLVYEDSYMKIYKLS